MKPKRVGGSICKKWINTGKLCCFKMKPHQAPQNRPLRIAMFSLFGLEVPWKASKVAPKLLALGQGR